MSLVLTFALLVSVFSGCKSSHKKEAKEPATNQGQDEAQEELVDDGALITDDWAKTAVFYEVFVRSFYDGNGDGIGDFQGLIEKIPYLKELGINALWLMPFNDSSSYHGYDVENYYDIDPDYGTMDDFNTFLDEAHKNNIKVIMDFVVNHTSSSHEWFLEGCNNPEGPYGQYYVFSDVAGENVDGTWYEKPVGEGFYFAHFAKTMPDLNFNNEAVRQEVKDIATYWLEVGIDGFRLDAAPEIDTDEVVTHTWWVEWNNHVKSVNKDAYIVGESWFETTDEIATFYGDMESSFNFILMDDLIAMANGMSHDVVKEIKTMHFKYKRASLTRGTDTFVDATMLTNHDRDRVRTQLNGDVEKAKLAAALLLTLPGTPFIYYGEEIGQMGQKPDDNRREPFDWYQSAQGDGMTTMTDVFYHPMAFTLPSDGISLEEQQATEKSIYEHYKQLIQIRNTNPMMFDSNNYETIKTDLGTYGYLIQSTQSTNRLIVVHNQRFQDIEVEITQDNVTDLMTDSRYKKGDVITLTPYNTVILQYSGETLAIKEAEGVQKEELYTITFRIKAPDNTPFDEKIYLVGAFNSWDPGDSNYVLERSEEGYYEIVMTQPAYAMLEFKFTRGNWDLREQNAAGEDLIGPEQSENRRLRFTKDNHIEEILIEKWSDQ